MASYYVHKNWAGAVFVKEAGFFEHQGGLTESWGQAWVRVEADTIESARAKGRELLRPDVPVSP